MVDTQVVSRAHGALAGLAVVILTAIAQPTAAQGTNPEVAEPPHWEFTVSSGRLLQTGAQRDAVQGGNTTTAQLWYVPSPRVAMTGSAGWARSQNLRVPSAPKRDIFTYDVGAELRTPRLPVTRVVAVRFVGGLGLGGQTHHDRDTSEDATHDLSAYGSVGAEIGVGRVAVRLEARDFVVGVNVFDGGRARARHSVAIWAGLRLGWR